MKFWIMLISLLAAAGAQAVGDKEFAALGERFVDEFTAYHPVDATLTGDHRYDSMLDEITASQRLAEVEFCRGYLAQLAKFNLNQLSPAHQVDAALLENWLQRRLFELEQLQEWAWNPLRYTALAGNAVYGLLARDFAPLPDRLIHATERLEQMPRLLAQVRATLQRKRVPRVHAETAIAQNRGVLSVLENFVRPQLDQLPAPRRQRLEAAMVIASDAVATHQHWLEDTLLPAATGDFRLGPALYDQKLKLTLQSALDRETIGRRATDALVQARQAMYEVAQQMYLQQYPLTVFPQQPDEAYRQAITRAALEVVYENRPQRGEIVGDARRYLEQATQFVGANDIVSVPEDPVEIIVMPEFRRGIALAYCDSPGALEAGQKTFYAVSPLPADWTAAQDASFLREYNNMGVQVLTIHEAVPGHYLQIAHANQYPSRLRAVLSSGSFIEGWAVYVEGVMQRNGYLDGDPGFHLIQLKLLIRAITNALMDQAIHAGDMSRSQAMELMVEQGFQEEREAAGKWVRAQLTAAQLSTYLVGYLEHTDLRLAAEQAWGETFSLLDYHDRVLSFGAPPVHYARALLLGEPVSPP